LKSKLKITLNKHAVQEKMLKKQAACLFILNAKILYFFKTFKLNKLYTFIKVHCVAQKLNDDIKKIINNKNLFKILNLNIFFNSLNFNFFINFKFSS